MICNEIEYRLANQAKIESIKSAIKPFYSWYLDTKFLKAFYIANSGIEGNLISNYVLNCYERLFEYWLKERVKRNVNEYQLNQNTQAYLAELKRLEANWFNQFIEAIKNIFGNLDLYLLLGLAVVFFLLYKKK